MDKHPVIPYLTALFENAGAIRLHLLHCFYGPPMNILSTTVVMKLPSHGRSRKFPFRIPDDFKTSMERLDKGMLMTLLSYPCCLGGFPVIQLVDLISHGFPDPVGLNLWGLRKLYLNCPDSYNVHKENILKIENPFFNPDVNSQMICEDPVSLNLLHGSTRSDKLKSLVFDFLVNMPVNNQVFIHFLRIAQVKQKTLSELLFQMEPFNPRIASTIMPSTIVGRANQVVKKINKTGTIISLMLKSKSKAAQDYLRNPEEDSLDFCDEEFGMRTQPKDMTKLYWIFEKNYLLGLIYNLTQKRNQAPELWRCSREHAQLLRSAGWKKHITGVTVAIPGELFTWESNDGTSCENQNHCGQSCGYLLLRTTLTYEEFKDRQYTNHGKGPFKPFFGAQTKNKVKYEGEELKKQAPPLLKGALDNLCLLGWGTEENSNLSDLILTISGSFTNLDPLDYIPEHTQISGSVEHRWTDQKTSHYSSLSISYQHLTFLNIITNFFKPENLIQCEGRDNVNLSFQSIPTFISCLWSTLCSYSELNNYFKSYHLQIECMECIRPIYEGMLDIPEPLTAAQRLSIQPPEAIDNPYCWIDSENLFKHNLKNCHQFDDILRIPDDPEILKELSHWACVTWVLKNMTFQYKDDSWIRKDLEEKPVLPVKSHRSVSYF